MNAAVLAAPRALCCVAAMALASGCGPLDLGDEADLSTTPPLDAAVPAADLAAPDLTTMAPPDLDRDLALPDLAERPPDLNCPGKLSVTPLSIDFGKVPAGRPSPRTTVKLENVSACYLQLRAGRLAGADGAAFTMDLLKYPWGIDPGQSQLVGVEVNAAAGKYAATVEFETSVVAQPVIGIPVTATVVAGDPRIRSDVPMVAFGAQPVGAMSNWQTVQLSNDGLADLHIGQVMLGGAMPGDFVLDVAGLRRTVPMGVTTSFRVAFKPLAVGPHAAQVLVGSDDPVTPNLALPLTGQGQ